MGREEKKNEEDQHLIADNYIFGDVNAERDLEAEALTSKKIAMLFANISLVLFFGVVTYYAQTFATVTAEHAMEDADKLYIDTATFFADIIRTVTFSDRPTAYYLGFFAFWLNVLLPAVFSPDAMKAIFMIFYNGYYGYISKQSLRMVTGRYLCSVIVASLIAADVYGLDNDELSTTKDGLGIISNVGLYTHFIAVALDIISQAVYYYKTIGNRNYQSQQYQLRQVQRVLNQAPYVDTDPSITNLRKELRLLYHARKAFTESNMTAERRQAIEGDKEAIPKDFTNYSKSPSEIAFLQKRKARPSRDIVLISDGAIIPSDTEILHAYIYMRNRCYFLCLDFANQNNLKAPLHLQYGWRLVWNVFRFFFGATSIMGYLVTHNKSSYLDASGFVFGLLCLCGVAQIKLQNYPFLDMVSSMLHGSCFAGFISMAITSIPLIRQNAYILPHLIVALGAVFGILGSLTTMNGEQTYPASKTTRFAFQVLMVIPTLLAFMSTAICVYFGAQLLLPWVDYQFNSGVGVNGLANPKQMFAFIFTLNAVNGAMFSNILPVISVLKMIADSWLKTKEIGGGQLTDAQLISDEVENLKGEHRSLFAKGHDVLNEHNEDAPVKWFSFSNAHH